MVPLVFFLTTTIVSAIYYTCPNETIYTNDLSGCPSDKGFVGAIRFKKDQICQDQRDGSGICFSPSPLCSVQCRKVVNYYGPTSFRLAIGSKTEQEQLLIRKVEKFQPIQIESFTLNVDREFSDQVDIDPQLLMNVANLTQLTILGLVGIDEKILAVPDSVTDLAIFGADTGAVLPKFTQSLKQLKKLSLPQNKIKQIQPETLLSFESLEILSLTSNELSAIPRQVLLSLGKLKELWLGDNPLVDFTLTEEEFEILKGIDLYMTLNQVTCDPKTQEKKRLPHPTRAIAYEFCVESVSTKPIPSRPPTPAPSSSANSINCIVSLSIILLTFIL